MTSTVAPYCVPLAERAKPSPPYTYQPFALPHGARLRTPPPALGHLQHGLPMDIPVLHTRDGYATPFYYYAKGCSDLYVRASKVMVTSNRVHALDITHKQRASAILKERCGQELLAANLSATRVVRWLSVERPDPSIPPKIAAISSGMCAHHLNAVLYSWMVRTDHDTLVLNYEYEGVPTSPLRWKAEVLHIGRLVYNSNHTACNVHVLDRRCVHCGRLSTPKTWAVCGV